MSKWVIGKYIRLSLADQDLMKKESKSENESISYQKALIMGVRFISINDHYDSADYKGTTGGLDVVMKNIVYDYYSKDLSVKVKTAKYQKMKQGKYLGGHVPYGLMKDPKDKHKLVIDPEAAAVVREIFDMAIAKMRLIDMARTLNERGVETPGKYYRRKHPGTKKFADTSDMVCWNHNNIRKILQQEMYYGAIVGHKRQGLGVGCKHTATVPKEEQFIVEGKHEGIVTKEEFLRAQEIFCEQRKAKKIIPKTYPLYRKVKCGTCGRAMTYKIYSFRGVDYKYFGCPHAKEQVGDDGCCKRYITEDNLILAEKLSKLQQEKEKCESDRQVILLRKTDNVCWNYFTHVMFSACFSEQKGSVFLTDSPIVSD